MSETLQHLPENRRGRDLLVGDLHGCVSLLEGELDRIHFDPETDRVIAVGDLIDRGPESDLVAYLLLKPWFYSVLGNHDISFAARVIEPQDWSRWEIPGAHPWATSLDEDHVDYLRRLFSRLPWALEIETEVGLVGVVHAEVPPMFHHWREFILELDGPIGPELRDQALNNRELHSLSGMRTTGDEEDAARYVLDGVVHVVHGHSPAPDYAVHRLANRYWIDCGAWEAAARPDIAARSRPRPRLAIVDARRPGALL